MSFSKVIRKEINDCEPYITGESEAAVRERYGITNVVKLGSNENPFGPFDNAKKAMVDSINIVNRYPEDDFLDLKKNLARKHHVQVKNVAVGSGAGNVLEILSKVFLNEGDEVLLGKQSYRLYKEISKMMGAVVKEIPLTDDYKFDLNQFRENITPKTKLIWICNPNNPTSTVVDPKELEDFTESLPTNVAIVVDEAYADFSDQRNLPNLTKYINKKKLVIVRTFSKFYGLAGVRIGYAVADQDIIQAYDTTTEPFSVSRTALAGANASLTKDSQAAEDIKNLFSSEKVRLTNELSALGLAAIESETNFLFVKCELKGSIVAEELMKKGVIVRDCTPWDYPNHIRVTLGTKQENDTFIERLTEVLTENMISK